jgi:hypothetical protein
MKNCDKAKSGRKDFLDHCLAEKAFFRQGILGKMYGKEAMRGKESKKRLIAKLMPIICVKGVVLKRPCKRPCAG